MLNPISPGQYYATTTLLLSASVFPSYSKYRGEIDLTPLLCNENGAPIEFSQLTRVTLDAIAGVSFRVLDMARQNEAAARDNVFPRLIFEIENQTGAPLNFTDARIILGGQIGTVGAIRPRASLAALAGASGTPFVAKNGAGAVLNLSQTAFSVVPIVANVQHAAVADAVDWSGITNKPASVGDSSYLFTQVSPATTWNVTHNLGKYPSVVIMDSDGNAVTGDVNYVNVNTCVLSFAVPFAGKAAFN